MKTRPDLRLQVDRVTTSPSPWRFEVPGAWWREQVGEGAVGDLAVPEAFVFELEISTMGEDLLLEGAMSGAVSAPCARCDARYRHALRETVRLVLEPVGSRSPSEPESREALARNGMCLGDELELGWYRGPEIHLGAFMSEVIALALPMQFLPPVDEDDRCRECGRDPAHRAESIEQAKPESPFAVLAKLRDPAGSAGPKNGNGGVS